MCVTAAILGKKKGGGGGKGTDYPRNTVRFSWQPHVHSLTKTPSQNYTTKDVNGALNAPSILTLKSSGSSPTAQTPF